MGRPRSFDGAAVARDVRDAFWRRGYTANSIRDLASAAGIKTGSLHASFGTKDRLFGLALDAYDPVFTSAFEVEDHGRDRLMRYVELLHDRVATGDGPRGCLIVAAASEIDDHTDENRLAILDRVERIRKFVAERLDEDPEDAPPHLADTIFGLVLALLTAARYGAAPDVLRNIRDGARALLYG
ncbi:MAG: TetR/AcrR family transcriptional regulator [Pseudomonadota bacterium]